MSQQNTLISIQPLLATIGTILGLSPSIHARLTAGEPIVGPSGFVCRIHTHRLSHPLRAFPEIILPLSARELGGDDVVRLLAVQETLLTECGWRFGMSEQGLLSLLPLMSESGAETIAALLNQGQTIGRSVLNVLTQSAPAGEALS